MWDQRNGKPSNWVLHVDAFGCHQIVSLNLPHRNSKVSFLYKTGAEVSLIDSRSLSEADPGATGRLEPPPPLLSPTNASGHHIPILGTYNANWEFWGRTSTLSLLVVPHLPSRAILGMDGIRALTLNYDARSNTVNNVRIEANTTLEEESVITIKNSITLAQGMAPQRVHIDISPRPRGGELNAVITITHPHLMNIGLLVQAKDFTAESPTVPIHNQEDYDLTLQAGEAIGRWVRAPEVLAVDVGAPTPPPLCGPTKTEWVYNGQPEDRTHQTPKISRRSHHLSAEAPRHLLGAQL